MSHPEAEAMRDRCAVLECVQDCSDTKCERAGPVRAACRAGTCVTEG